MKLSRLKLLSRFAGAVAGVCLTVLIAGAALAEAPYPAPAHLVFLISEDPLNYEAHKTVPPFADSLRKLGYRVTVLKGRGTHAAFRFDGLEALDKADLLIVFCRRVALPHAQMERIRGYLKAGKPVLGIRTANHGFSVREKPQAGYEGWWGFVPDILGCENRGYEPEELGTRVRRKAENASHPILKGIGDTDWKSQGQVYKVAPLTDPEATILLTSTIARVPAGTTVSEEPSAWVHTTYYGGKAFYTALGYPSDFKVPQFRQLLVNAIQWSLQ